MIRYPEKFYLTKEGLKRLKKEFKDLNNLKFSKIKEEIPEIWRSKGLNLKYLSLQEDSDILESRIAELEYILKNTELINLPKKEEQDVVNLGAIVSVEINGEIDEFKIVGTLEADPSNKKISNESLVGKALLGKKTGELVVIKTPIINHTCRIIKIKYE